MVDQATEKLQSTLQNLEQAKAQVEAMFFFPLDGCIDGSCLADLPMGYYRDTFGD